MLYNPEIAQKKFEDKVESLKKLRKKPKKAKNAAEELNNDLRMGTLLFKEILEKVDISRNTILKNAALARRFNEVKVNAPSAEDTYKILQGIRDLYEKHHNVILPDSSTKFKFYSKKIKK